MVNEGFPNTESSVTLGLLKAVASDKRITQRSAASELGVALGLVNTYLLRYEVGVEGQTSWVNWWLK